MIRNIIRYVGLTIVIIGIVVLMSSFFNRENSKFKSSDKNSLSNTKYYTASIRVLDKESRKFINGGKFLLKDDDGKVIDEWDNEENIHRVEKLKNGTYVLVQKSASEGYKKANNYRFKIVGSDKDVIIYNEIDEEKEVITSDEVVVDNTLSLIGWFRYIVAILIIGSGFGLIFIQKRCYNK